MIRMKLRVSGRVQGVFFRASAKREAEWLGLTGFARNEPDGSVTIEVQGEELNVKKFLEWAKRGPRRAEVDNFKASEIDTISADQKKFVIQ